MKKLNIILTCDGGNGHKAAAESIQNSAIASNNDYQVINTSQSGWFSGGGPNITYKYDQYWSKGIIDLGPLAARLWNWAQRTSNSELLRIMAGMRRFSFLSIPSFRYRTYNLLSDRKDIDTYSEVILHNTQPNCLQALVFSTARYNREVDAYNQSNPDGSHRNKVRFINHFTDMPTQQAEMFIEEIAKIDPADLDDAQFELHTRPPILNEEDTNKELSDLETTLIYHRQMKSLYPNLYKNLAEGQSRIKFVDGPIRPEFLHRKTQPAKRTDGLTIQFANSSEYDAMKTLFTSELTDFQEDNKVATLSLNEQVEITSLMLGSQASIDGTLSLIHEEIEAAAASDETTNKYLFVFCGADKPENGLFLYRKVLNIASKLNADPNKRINIIPLTNQSAPFIADLYSMADKVISRPGGISIMEIEAVVKKGKIFIFTELSKLEKLANYLLGYTTDDLKRHFTKQASQTRLSDLIAWESGNALHAQNKCIDKQSRTRVVPMNAYTYRHELDLLAKKELVMTVIQQKRYNDALQLYKNDAELTLFMLTGDDTSTDLACICEVLHFNDQIIKQLNRLITKNSELRKLINGPNVCLHLIEKMNKEVKERVEQNDEPASILKYIGPEMERIKYSFLVSIDAVKDSNLQNKSHILKVLSSIANHFINFFCFIFDLNFKKPAFDIENTQQYFVNNLPVCVSQRINKYEDTSALFLITDLDDNEWVEFEQILLQRFDENPDLKNQSFKISKSEYPQLKHDFMYCSASQPHASTSYVLGRVLGEGGYGKVTLIQDKQGKTAVAKEHFSTLHGKAVQSFIHDNEIPCLERMGMLMRDSTYHYSNTTYSSEQITIQKYIHGISFADFVIEKREGIFTKYKTFTEDQKLKIALTLANGLKSCIDKGIVHGDITPQNIIIHKSTKAIINATYIDYGLAQLGHSPKLNYCPYISPYYGAPELLAASKQYKEGDQSTFPYSEASDVYSLGVLLKDFGINPKITSKMTTPTPNTRLTIEDVITMLSDKLYTLDDAAPAFSSQTYHRRF